MNDGDAAAEAAKHLAKLHADISATENQQMLREVIQLHDGSVVQNIRKRLQLVQTSDGRQGGAQAGVDENFVGGEVEFAAVVFLDIDGFGCGKSGRAVDEIEIVCAEHGLFVTVAGLQHDLILTLDNAWHVDASDLGVDAEIFGATGHVSDASAAHHGFCGRAAGVDASATDKFALDHCGAPSSLGERF